MRLGVVLDDAHDRLAVFGQDAREERNQALEETLAAQVVDHAHRRAEQRVERVDRVRRDDVALADHRGVSLAAGVPSHQAASASRSWWWRASAWASARASPPSCASSPLSTSTRIFSGNPLISALDWMVERSSESRVTPGSGRSFS